MQEMYWYIAKDEKGRKGMVPGNFLKPLKGSGLSEHSIASLYPCNLLSVIVVPKIMAELELMSAYIQCTFKHVH